MEVNKRELTTQGYCKGKLENKNTVTMKMIVALAPSRRMCATNLDVDILFVE